MSAPANIVTVGSNDVTGRLIARTRLELGDIDFPFSFEIVGDGERRYFRLEHRPVDLTTIMMTQTFINEGTPPVRVQDSIYETGAFSAEFALEFEPITLHAPSYIIDADAGMIVFAVAPSIGTRYEIFGRKWRYFTDDDLLLFVNTSIGFNTKSETNSSGGPLDVSEIPALYEYPIALYAVIQALWALVTDASFDIDIQAPDGVHIPRSERFQQLLSIIGARQMQYDEMAAMLNIGLSAIEVFTMRRTARLTNRLVPVFLPAEYDDGSKPKRLLEHQMMLGSTPVKTHVSNYNIDVYSGSNWSVVIDFDRDLTGYIPQAEVRIAKGTGQFGASLTKFNFEILDAAAGTILMWLTPDQTRRLPYMAYWEFQLRWTGDPTWEPVPFLSGVIRTSITEVVK